MFALPVRLRVVAPPTALVVLAALAVPAAATAAPAGATSAVAARPVPPKLATTALEDVARHTGEGALTVRERTLARGALAAAGRAGSLQPGVLQVSDPRPVPEGASVVGVTWARGSGAGASVQYRTQSNGVWTPWTFLEVDTEHAPDAAEAGRAGERDGSDPLAVTGAQAVQVRVLGTPAARPAAAQLVVVDPGSSTADPARSVAPAGALAPSAPALTTAPVRAPAILTRAQWGADESLRDPSALTYGAVKAAVVHHTVNANTYTSAQVPALIRGIYAFHVKGRGWSDIGYNFLIDRFGRTWEGRYGGVHLPVVGAHTGGHNSWTTGMSVIGDFTSAAVPSAVTNALTALIAWKAQVHEFDPLGRANVGNLAVHSVMGHRDAGGTACPGAVLYAKLPALRSAAGARVRGLPSLSLDRDLDNGGDADVIATNAAQDLLLYPTSNRSTITGPRKVVAGTWRGVDLVTIAGDFNGDGPVDMIARVPATGALLLYPGNGSGSFLSRRAIGNGWDAVDTIVGVSDWNGDGRPDLLARMRGDGSLRLYPGNGRGGFLAASTIGHGWGGMRLLSGIGDWSGDGARDLLAVGRDGVARIYYGNGRGGFAGVAVLAGSWAGYRSVNGVGDATGDTRTDLFVVAADGTGYLGSSVAGSTTTSWTRQATRFDAVDVYSG